MPVGVVPVHLPLICPVPVPSAGPKCRSQVPVPSAGTKCRSPVPVPSADPPLKLLPLVCILFECRPTTRADVWYMAQCHSRGRRPNLPSSSAQLAHPRLFKVISLALDCHNRLQFSNLLVIDTLFVCPVPLATSVQTRSRLYVPVPVHHKGRCLVYAPVPLLCWCMPVASWPAAIHARQRSRIIRYSV
jgi:hypothetical protein